MTDRNVTITGGITVMCFLAIIYLISLSMAIKSGYMMVAIVFSSLGSFMGFLCCALLTINKE